MINTRSTVAMMFALATSVVAAQSTAPQSQPAAPATPQTSTTVTPTATVVGCLYREDQVPGRKPNVAERAGILEDYILADASASSGQGTPSSTPGATGTSGTAALTTGNMYKVEKLADDQLKALVGKRVEVTGKIEPEGGPLAQGGARRDRIPGGDTISLPEIEGASIREIAGTCPSSPAPLK